MLRFKLMASAFSVAAFGLVGAAAAGDADSCKKVRISDVGWTDNQATSGILSNVLPALGYEPEIIQLSVPVTFESLKNNDLDVFFDNWMPSQTGEIKPFLDDGSVETVATNLEGAGYGLVVPSYMADAGIKTLKDLGKPEAKEQLDGKIYGIEAGNDGNRIVLDMIKDPANGLDGYELVESSEAGMLTQAESLMKDNKWVVFLGWTPHPVMGAMKITYLDGMGESGFGGAEVKTVARKGYAAECPNLGKFITQVKFSLPMENEIMDGIIKGGEGAAVAKEWLKKNPDAVTPWLSGVTTFDGGDAAAAVKAALEG
jgi:glycine betaine/proline transport system substrate-binding protein